MTNRERLDKKNPYWHCRDCWIEWLEEEEE